MSHAAAVIEILARERSEVTKYEFVVAVEVKNDALTRESTPGELAAMLSERLSENGLRDLPWVIAVEVEATP